MVILPTEEKPKKLIFRNFIFILITLVIIGGLFYFSTMGTPSLPVSVVETSIIKLDDIDKIEKNLGILDNPKLSSLYSFGRLPTLKETLIDIEKGIGRENPFLPY